MVKNRRSIGFALLAALGFGVFYLSMDQAANIDVYWAIGVSRGVAVTVLLVAAVLFGQRIRAGGHIGGLLMIGFLDLAAHVLFALATTTGLVSIASVLAALYPVTTVALAIIVLREKLSRAQIFGVVAAMVGVVFIAGG